MNLTLFDRFILSWFIVLVVMAYCSLGLAIEWLMQ
jgi:hypothetical protein